MEDTAADGAAVADMATGATTAMEDTTVAGETRRTVYDDCSACLLSCSGIADREVLLSLVSFVPGC